VYQRRLHLEDLHLHSRIFLFYIYQLHDNEDCVLSQITTNLVSFVAALSSPGHTFIVIPFESPRTTLVVFVWSGTSAWALRYKCSISRYVGYDAYIDPAVDKLVQNSPTPSTSPSPSSFQRLLISPMGRGRSKNAAWRSATTLPKGLPHKRTDRVDRRIGDVARMRG
jgi:hypothetical protein